MNADKINFMSRNNGLYVLADERSPGSTFTVVVQGAKKDANGTDVPGLMHTMRPHQQISLDASQWPESTTFVGGPFSIQTCETREEELQVLDNSVDFWRTMATNCRPHLIFYRDFMLKSSLPEAQGLAAMAQHMLDEIQHALDCERVFALEKQI